MSVPQYKAYSFVFETAHAYHDALQQSGVSVDDFNTTPLLDEFKPAFNALNRTVSGVSDEHSWRAAAQKGYAASMKALAVSVEAACEGSFRNRHIRRAGWLGSIGDALRLMPSSQTARLAFMAYQREGQRDVVIPQCFPLPGELPSYGIAQDAYYAAINQSLVYVGEHAKADVISKITLAVGRNLLEKNIAAISKLERLDVNKFFS